MIPCHCEKRSAEAISRIEGTGRGIAASLTLLATTVLSSLACVNAQ
jgi:hypothetical protein